MPRFFVSDEQISADGKTLSIVGDDAYHIARALRAAVGDSLTVCDTKGTVYRCRLTRIRDERADAEILSTEESAAEPATEIRLFMAYPKGDKLETVIQKAVELGAARITPFLSEYCVKRPPEEKQARLLERQRKIASEAAKQCGRAKIPTVDAPLSFEDAVSQGAGTELPLFCYEGAGTKSLRAVLSSHVLPATCAVMVGAEGGFSEKEAKMLADAGWIPVNLGPRILRCETAPAYALSALSYAYELSDTAPLC